MAFILDKLRNNKQGPSMYGVHSDSSEQESTSYSLDFIEIPDRIQLSLMRSKKHVTLHVSPFKGNIEHKNIHSRSILENKWRPKETNKFYHTIYMNDIAYTIQVVIHTNGYISFKNFPSAGAVYIPEFYISYSI